MDEFKAQEVAGSHPVTERRLPLGSCDTLPIGHFTRALNQPEKRGQKGRSPSGATKLSLEERRVTGSNPQEGVRLFRLQSRDNEE